MPAYNEEKYLSAVIKKTLRVTANIVLVDDGSRDSTALIARKYLAHVLRHEINLGKGAAMTTGTQYAFSHVGAKAVVFLDSDDQHDPREFHRFVEAFQTGSQVVFGVRKFSASQMPLLRFVGNKAISIVVNLLYGGFIPDIPSGYKGLTKPAYHKIRWQSRGYEVETEIAAKVAGARIPFTTLDIETIYHDTDKGMNALEAIKICFALIQWKLGG